VNVISGATAILVLAAWCVAGLAGIASAGLIFLPAQIWTPMLRRTGNVWMYALAVDPPRQRSHPSFGTSGIGFS